MDKTVSVRFYQISRMNDADELFSTTLEWIFANKHNEWIEIREDVYIRLERLTRRSGVYEGEFTRRQVVNIPPKARDGRPLEPSRDPIAHRAAFRYDPQLDIFALEFNRNGLSCTRINEYIREAASHNGFGFLPAMSETAFERFKLCTPKSFTIKVAHPENLRSVENATSRTVAGNINAMKDAFGGPVVEITVGWGRYDGSLNPRSLMDVVRSMMRNKAEGADIQKMQIKAEGEEEIIDLLGEQMKTKETLDLNDNDLDAHYDERRRFIMRAFNSFKPTLQQIYGTGT